MSALHDILILNNLFKDSECPLQIVFFCFNSFEIVCMQSGC